MTKRRTAALLVAAAIITLAGCGGDDNSLADLSADEILADAKEAATAAETVSVSGDVTEEGMEIALDMGFGPDGASGTMTFQGVEFEMLSVGGEFYLKAGADTWAGLLGDAAGEVADQYVLVPPDDPRFAQFVTLTDFDGFIDEMLTPSGTLTKGEETEINGESVIGLDDGSGTIYIATSGDPLPIQLAAPEGETGSLDFDWGATVEVVAPDEDDFIDLTEIM